MSARWRRGAWPAVLVPVLLMMACSAEEEGPSGIGFIFFTSEPQGARIALDGEETAQVTPARLETTVGNHQWRLNLDGYAPEEGSVTITGQGQTKRVERSGQNETPALRRLIALTLALDPPAQTIVVDEATVSDEQPGTDGFQLTLPEGTHRVQASARGYFDRDDQTNITRATRTIQLRLDVLPQLGVLTFHFRDPTGQGTFLYTAPIVAFAEQDFDRGLRGPNDVRTAVWGRFEVRSRVARTFQPQVVMLFNGRDPRTFQQVVEIRDTARVGDLVDVLLQNSNLVPGEDRGVYMQAGEYEVQIVWKGDVLARGNFRVAS